jgi:predicted peptidase
MTIERFRQLEYHDEANGGSLLYNLFVPEGAPDGLPLVLFMGDATTVGPDPTLPLRRCLGARVWVEPALQADHPCIVLVPQFSRVAVNDAWETTPEVPLVLGLLAQVVREYRADRNHLFVTGQSMGGMLALHFNAIRPHLFAASLFVACQWDPAVLAPLANKRFCYVAAAGDQKASNGMRQLQKVLLDNGSPGYAYSTIDARSPQLNEHVGAMILHRLESRRIFLTFEKGTVLPPDCTDPEHMYSFDCAYRLTSLHKWLLAPPKKR